MITAWYKGKGYRIQDRQIQTNARLKEQGWFSKNYASKHKKSSEFHMKTLKLEIESSCSQKSWQSWISQNSIIKWSAVPKKFSANPHVKFEIELSENRNAFVNLVWNRNPKWKMHRNAFVKSHRNPKWKMQKCETQSRYQNNWIKISGRWIANTD